MASVLNRPWLELNEGRSYPLAPWATATDLTGSFRLPPDFLVELSFGVAAGLAVDATLFYVSQVSSTPAGYAVTLGYAGSPAVPAAATAAVAASALAGQEYVPVALAGAGDFADCTGRVVIGRTDGILAQPPGLWAFGLAGAQLDVDCVVPQARGVSAIYVSNGAETLGPFSGDVEFAAGTNSALGYAPGTVTISAISGAGLSTACGCAAAPAAAVPVSSLNGVPAGTAGAFSILGDACIAVDQVAAGFRLTDACSSPCCGPAELAALVAQLGQLSSAVATLRQFVTALQASQAATNQAVMASKIGDQGCLTCG